MKRPVQMLGNPALMDLPKVSFLSSRKIAPEAVLKCYDWAIRMRDEGRCVIGGFQSPLEKDVLKFLLKGKQPVVMVLARGIYRVVPAALRGAVAEGRLLIVSPFPAGARRTDRAAALVRNRFILENSAEHVFGFIDPGGELSRLVCDLCQKSVSILSDVIIDSSRILGGR